MATRKILEKMKQDENLRSFEGSSGPLSDELEDSDEDDEEEVGPPVVGVEGTKAKSARGARPSGGTRFVRIIYQDPMSFKLRNSITN